MAYTCFPAPLVGTDRDGPDCAVRGCMPRSRTWQYGVSRCPGVAAGPPRYSRYPCRYPSRRECCSDHTPLGAGTAATAASAAGAGGARPGSRGTRTRAAGGVDRPTPTPPTDLLPAAREVESSGRGCTPYPAATPTTRRCALANTRPSPP